MTKLTPQHQRNTRDFLNMLHDADKPVVGIAIDGPDGDPPIVWPAGRTSIFVKPYDADSKGTPNLDNAATVNLSVFISFIAALQSLVRKNPESFGDFAHFVNFALQADLSDD